MTDAAVRAGNDLMLGYGMAETNKLTDIDSPTLVKALRQACKNILYTVGNSGYYTDPTAMEMSSVDNMANLFKTLNVSAAAAVILLEAVVVIRWLLKKKKAKAQAANA